MRASVLALAVASAAWAQSPRINYRGVVNAASFMPPGLPGGSIARGSIFSVFGAGIGPTASPSLSFPLQTTLGGVSIRLTQGSTAVQAIPVFVGPGQINAIAPSNTPLGLVSLQLSFNNLKTATVPVVVVNSSFGIFTISGGKGPGILQNFVSASEQPVNSLSSTAQPGQTIILWGTGLGPVSFADNGPPTAGTLATQTEVFVGGIPAQVTYSGRTPCCAGVDQIVFQVPANAPTGCWVPVLVRTGGVMVSNVVTMAISSDGSPCSEPSNPMAGPLITGGRTARALAARITVHQDVGVANTNDTVADVSGVYLAQETPNQFNFDPTVSLPPGGSCTVYAYSGDLTLNSGFPPGLPPSKPTGRALDAGLVALARGTELALQYNATTAMTFLGAAVPTLNAAQSYLFLNPGDFTLLAVGGADVGAIQAPMTMPAPLTWTNRDQLQNVARSQGFTANWNAVPTGHSVFVSGLATDLPTNATAVFVCVAKPGDTSLTVPPYVLANFAATRARTLQSRGAIYVGSWPIGSPVQFTASGLNTGVLLPIGVSGRTVMFQ